MVLEEGHLVEKALDVANKLVAAHFPNCSVALLAGSYVRGDDTATSDLDIVIIDNQYEMSFRQSFYFLNYPVECFVHNKESYKAYVEADIERARPSLLNMIREGIVIQDDGFASTLKAEIDSLYRKGPKKWSEQEEQLKRYLLTDILDDFMSCTNEQEELFIAGQLLDQLHEYILRMNGYWIGSGKWIYRALERFDPEIAKEFGEAAQLYYRNKNKTNLVNLAEKWLNKYGGKLFDGFQAGQIIKK